VTSADESPHSGDEVREKRRKRRRIIAGLVVAVVVAILVLPGISKIQPRYYERYPSLRPAIALWETSTHARMTCRDCHVNPGLWSHIRFGFEAVPAFYSQLLFGPNDENVFPAPPTESCLSCHTVTRLVSADGDLRIPHAAHITELGVECVDCHLELVHYENPLGLNRPPMTMCMDTCHDGERAGEECVKCHTRKNVPDDHLEPNWLEIHQEESEKQDCGECHAWSPNYCDQCHQERPRSHDEGNFRTLHATRAAVNSEGCMFCHEEADCLQCH